MATVAIDARDASGVRLRGWGRYARELIAALHRLQPDGIEVQALDGGGRAPELVWEQLTLPRLLNRAHASAVHVPNCFLPLRRPCPGVVTVHDLAFEEHRDDFTRRTGWKYRTFAPRALRSAERVICASEFTRDDVHARYGVDPGKLRVIPLAPAIAAGGGEPPQGPYLLAVGDLRRKKNLVRLAGAFRKLWEEGLPHRLLIAGADAGEGRRIRAAAGDAPVELLGWVGDEQLDALMRGAEALVHPSLYEGFGLVLAEAMARGCPVACARSTALPETAGDAAAYFDPRNEEDIADALRRLLERRDERARLAELGRKRVAALSWERTAASTVAVYREVLR
jgi:glycosyltransferase involved in cell wall biosynthesis